MNEDGEKEKIELKKKLRAEQTKNGLLEKKVEQLQQEIERLRNNGGAPYGGQIKHYDPHSSENYGGFEPEQGWRGGGNSGRGGGGGNYMSGGGVTRGRGEAGGGGAYGGLIGDGINPMGPGPMEDYLGYDPSAASTSGNYDANYLPSEQQQEMTNYYAQPYPAANSNEIFWQENDTDFIGQQQQQVNNTSEAAAIIGGANVMANVVGPMAMYPQMYDVPVPKNAKSNRKSF